MKTVYNIRNNTTDNIIETLLKSRDVKDIDKFLNPSKEDLIDLDKLSNIEKACDVLLNCIKDNKKILIHFDNDADGCTAGAIMYNYLKEYTGNVDWSINQGKVHGLRGQDIEKLKKYDLVIACDSLSNEYDVYEHLSVFDTNVILLDHHPGNKTKFAITVNSQMDRYPNKELSGAGVVWKFCKYVDSVTGQEYADDLVDLATVGIIADMMDVRDTWENRYICNLGFSNLRNPGIKAIIKQYRFNGQAVGYSIAPLVNAANRMNKNELAVKLFITDDEDECVEIVDQLKKIKAQQDYMIKDIVKDIEKDISDDDIGGKKVLWGIHNEDSISGLIANTFANKYMRPSIMVKEKENEYAGSIRGYGVDNFRDMIQGTGLAKCNGHPAAAGIKIPKDNLNKLKETLEDILKDVEFKIVKDIDLSLYEHQVTYELIDIIHKLNLITGKNFPIINVIIKNVKINSVYSFSNYKHLSVKSGKLNYIYWNKGGLKQPRYEKFNTEYRTQYKEAYEIQKASFNNNFVSFIGNLDINPRNNEIQLIINDYIILD